LGNAIYKQISDRYSFKSCGMTEISLKNFLKPNMMIFKPAIALMNRLKYPQKFFLISLLFVLPLALVMNLLLSELDSRIDFTQKELYGNTYLRPLNQLWQNIPRKQLILQRQSYRNFQGLGFQDLGSLSQAQAQELLNLQNKIEQEFITLSNVDMQLGAVVQTVEKLSDIKLSWQKLKSNLSYAEFRNYDLLLEQLDHFRVNIVDASNLILDPDLDTYYLMDAIALKLPEMQKILHKIMQTEAEVVFKKEITNEKKALLISLTSVLNGYKSELSSNLVDRQA
jgi:sigma-B regulation protein RsbU (phosphoserine phosphatase)